MKARERRHTYAAGVTWTGASDGATRDYTSYSRRYEIRVAGKEALPGSADPTFRGEADRHNPEELLVAALSACHLLTYLALCAREGIAVVAYDDDAVGEMLERAGAGAFVSVELRPRVRIAGGSSERALELHELAHRECFVANSVNFPVTCTATIVRAE